MKSDCDQPSECLAIVLGTFSILKCITMIILILFFFSSSGHTLISKDLTSVSKLRSSYRDSGPEHLTPRTLPP